MKKNFFWEHIVYFWELLYNVYTIKYEKQR